MKQFLLIPMLLAAAFTLAGCDNQDSRLSDADVLCLKMQAAGGTCAGAATNTTTATITTTNTATATNTTTVTVTTTTTN